MRPGLPLMLTVSLALHGGVMAVFFLRGFSTTTTMAEASSESKSTSLVLLSSENVSDLQLSNAPSSAPAADPVAVNKTPATLPSPETEIETKSVPTMPAPSLALATDSTADIRGLTAKAILSPASAPHLDGRNGVVFVLDVSGSMYEPYAGSTRLAYARETLRDRILALKDGTPFAVTLYGEQACNSGPLVAACDATREAAVRFLQSEVDCGGGTNLPAGFAAAEQLAPGRLVLATDGDLNMKLPELLTLSRAALNAAGHRPALNVIGIGPRANTGDGDLLQSLADQQGGSYHAEQFAASPELLTASRMTPSVP